MDHYSLIKKAIHYLEDNYQKNPSLEEISQYLGLSPTHFQKVFTEWAGVSPKKFQQFIHLVSAKKVLKEDSTTLLDASVDLGLDCMISLLDGKE